MGRSKTVSSAAPMQDSPATAAAAPATKKSAGDFIVRFLSTVVMLGHYCALIYFGHTVAVATVLGVTTMIFHEVTSLPGPRSQSSGVSTRSRRLSWYFYGVTVFFLYGHTLRAPLLQTWPALRPALDAHPFAAYMLFVFGIMVFVASLRPGMYLQQFGAFAWTHMLLFYVVLQSAAFVYNIFDGMIWFLMPVSLIVANDIWAYMCGRYLPGGRHSLIALSPKKTWEGFIGGAVCTFICGLCISTLLVRWPALTCPKEAFLVAVDCQLSPTFLPQPYELPSVLATPLSWVGLSEYAVLLVRPVQLHSLALACFASLVAPFGGFFGSGLKRAFAIKDFDSLIPGHGGLTDRMDCQGLMATFTMIYLLTFVHVHRPGQTEDYAAALRVASTLPQRDRVQLVNALVHRLASEGVAIRSNGSAVVGSERGPPLT